MPRTPSAKNPPADAFVRVEVTSRKAWRAWLRAHHKQTESIWLVVYKKHCGERHVPWEAVVNEALCYGWIDSRTRRLDEDRTMYLVSPRRPGSTWSARNKQYVAELEAEGRLAAPGRAKIAAAKKDGSWSALDAVEALEEPPDLKRALDRNKKARTRFDAFPGSARKVILLWLHGAKRPQTREKRIKETVRLAALGLKAAHPESRGK